MTIVLTALLSASGAGVLAWLLTRYYYGDPLRAQALHFSGFLKHMGITPLRDFNPLKGGITCCSLNIAGDLVQRSYLAFVANEWQGKHHPYDLQRVFVLPTGALIVLGSHRAGVVWRVAGNYGVVNAGASGCWLRDFGPRTYYFCFTAEGSLEKARELLQFMSSYENWEEYLCAARLRLAQEIDEYLELEGHQRRAEFTLEAWKRFLEQISDDGGSSPLGHRTTLSSMLERGLLQLPRRTAPDAESL